MPKTKKPTAWVSPLSRFRDLLPSRHWRSARHRASGFIASELRSKMYSGPRVARSGRHHRSALRWGGSRRRTPSHAFSVLVRAVSFAVSFSRHSVDLWVAVYDTDVQDLA